MTTTVTVKTFGSPVRIRTVSGYETEAEIGRTENTVILKPNGSKDVTISAGVSLDVQEVTPPTTLAPAAPSPSPSSASA